MQERRRQPLVRALKKILNAVRPSALPRRDAAVERLTDAHVALRRDLRAVQESVNRLSAVATQAEQRTQQLLDAVQRDVQEQARFAAVPRATLLSEKVLLEGSPGQRLRVERVPVGQTVERSFEAWMGVTRCASAAADVRVLWERLLASEAQCGGILRGLPSTVLDVLSATVSRTAAGTLRVALRPPRHAATIPAGVDKDMTLRDAVCAVPKFTYDCPPRKLRNFGHWLLDCAPHVVALASIAPDAVFLLPRPLRGFHRSILSLTGLTSGQMIAWDGTPVECARLLVFESDGRTGGGRPLSALMELRRLITPPPETATGARRRIYVSRRDARAKRRWLSNELEVEDVFRRRGFEVLLMADCPLDEQVRVFREARIVAGISGAGLADIVFSPPGTHVIALISDSLIRWYADQKGQRSAWASGARSPGPHLARLGDSPRFYAHVAAACEQYCHCFVGGDELPLDALTRFLDEVLTQVDRA